MQKIRQNTLGDPSTGCWVWQQRTVLDVKFGLYKESVTTPVEMLYKH